AREGETGAACLARGWTHVQSSTVVCGTLSSRRTNMCTLRAVGIVAVAGLAIGLATPIAAQSATQTHVEHGASPAVMQALIADVEAVEEKFVALAEAMPEASHDWRPDEGVRSMTEVLMHVAADNYFIPVFAGTPAPATTGIEGTSYPSVQAFEARQVDKAAAIQELRTSFDHLMTVMRAVDEEALARVNEVFGQEVTGLELWVMATTHLHEHLGQSIAYARANDVVPPWSQ
ncbi:MAG: DinB family protein, partial [Longimicrobiales bacterium]